MTRQWPLRNRRRKGKVLKFNSQKAIIIRKLIQFPHCAHTAQLKTLGIFLSRGELKEREKGSM